MFVWIEVLPRVRKIFCNDSMDTPLDSNENALVVTKMTPPTSSYHLLENIGMSI